MILETRLGPKTLLLIDCESTSAIDKGEGGGDNADPDQVLTSARQVIQSIASELTGSLDLNSIQAVEVEFSVKISGSAAVVIGQRPGDGQFHVRLKMG